ncbi:MAG: TolC family protein, partial [Bacteroidales bacterium]|nr:TolC family protein [Bacteroidales bacterium]
TITAAGEYIHMSNDNEAQESIGELLKPITDNIGAIANISGIFDKLNSITLSFPLLDQNISSIDGAITWPIFSGGKRIYANRIGKSAIKYAGLIEQAAEDNQSVLLIERYYTAKLTSEIVKVQQQNMASMRRLYSNALKLMETGIINKAEMLVAKVASQEAERELKSALNNDSIANTALLYIIGSTPTTNATTNATTNTATKIKLASPFFISTNLPPKEYFKRITSSGNPQLNMIKSQQEIASNNFKIARSGYLPDIAAFGKQNIYSYNIPKNLSPRTTVGAGFIWNIFDGLYREKSMQIAKNEQQLLELGESQLNKELDLVLDRLYSQLCDLKNSLPTINTTIELATELVKIQEKSFAEGMATSLEVANAHTLLAQTTTAAATIYCQYDITLAMLLAIAGESSSFLSYLTRADLFYQ